MKGFPQSGRLFAYLILAAVFTIFGCKSNQNSQTDQTNPSDQSSNQPAADQTQNSGDPANANVVPISNTTRGTAAPSGQASTEQPSSGQEPSGQEPSRESDQYSPDQYNQDNGYGEEPETYAQQPPPEMPQYEQPPCPEEGDMWTPGYWAWAQPSGYYWVPGAWVNAPYEGALWTPPYWGWRDGRYAFYRGYWGRHIGYYGGINYGFGYVGFGYQGGYWRGNGFYYNTRVNRVNTTVIRNVYSYNVTNVTVNRVSYNGPGGVQYQPRPAEVMAIREQHTAPMATQLQIRQQAQTNRAMFYNTNRGRPATVVEARALPADRNVQPPPQVNYARGERPPVPPAIQRQQSAAATARPQGRPAPQVEQPQNRPGERPQVQQPQNRPAERPQVQQPQSRPAERPQAQPQNKPAEHPQSQPQRPPAQHTTPQQPQAKKPEQQAQPQHKPQPETKAKPEDKKKPENKKEQNPPQ